MTDETVAFALARTDPAARPHGDSALRRAPDVVRRLERRHRARRCWPATPSADPAAFGIDGGVPGRDAGAGVAVPEGAGSGRGWAAAAGAVVALIATPVLPPGLPVLVALLGLLAAGRPDRRGGADELAGRAHPGRGDLPAAADRHRAARPGGGAGAGGALPRPRSDRAAGGAPRHRGAHRRRRLRRLGTTRPGWRSGPCWPGAGCRSCWSWSLAAATTAGLRYVGVP